MAEVTDSTRMTFRCRFSRPHSASRPNPTSTDFPIYGACSRPSENQHGDFAEDDISPLSSSREYSISDTTHLDHSGLERNAHVRASQRESVDCLTGFIRQNLVNDDR